MGRLLPLPYFRTLLLIEVADTTSLESDLAERATFYAQSRMVEH
jgi:hypothetical protein